MICNRSRQFGMHWKCARNTIYRYMCIAKRCVRFERATVQAKLDEMIDSLCVVLMHAQAAPLCECDHVIKSLGGEQRQEKTIHPYRHKRCEHGGEKCKLNKYFEISVFHLNSLNRLMLGRLSGTERFQITLFRAAQNTKLLNYMINAIVLHLSRSLLLDPLRGRWFSINPNIHITLPGGYFP